MLGLGLLALWSWQKWNQVWVQNSHTYFPFQQMSAEDSEDLSWRYPIYRSNDTYQWVYTADSLARGHPAALRYRLNEGPDSGRANSWSSGLAHLLHFGGARLAAWQDWPTIRGIHHLSHWLGTLLLLSIITIMGLLLLRIHTLSTAVIFALLYFFTPAIAWDFSFSRIDHDVLFQISLILQAIGLFQLYNPNTQHLHRWAVAGGIGAGLAWWTGATVQSAIGCLILLASLIARSHKKEASDPLETLSNNPWITWGITATFALAACILLDHRWQFIDSINALHPIFIFAQIGAALVSAIGLRPSTRIKQCVLIFAFILGLAPVYWIALKGGNAHVWFDPLQLRFHQVIVEMQSPIQNQLWKTPEFCSLALISIAALITTRWRMPSQRGLAVLMLGLTVLSLLQTRWIGLAATVGVLALCLNPLVATAHPEQRLQRLKFICALLISAFAIFWVQHWRSITTKPGTRLITDFYTQIAGRDVNFNIDAYCGHQPTRVILPMDFTLASTLFENVYPLGTFYWENKAGLSAACALYSATSHTEAEAIVRHHNIQYIAVSRLQLGIPFANLANEIYNGSAAAPVESTLAWQLSFGKNIPEWCEELPYYGSIDPRTFSARIYRVIE
jgi:hypothetical protein